jgi:hypothetical protein
MRRWMNRREVIYLPNLIEMLKALGLYGKVDISRLTQRDFILILQEYQALLKANNA